MDDEDGQNAEGAGPGECQEDAEGAGDAFAAAEAEPDGEDVAEDSGDGADDGEVVVVGGESGGDLDGEERLAEVE